MKIEVYPGLDPKVFELIGPFAMDMKSIKDNGNPITTSKLHKWYIGFDSDGYISCFCSVRYSEGTKNMQMDNIFILSGKTKSFNALVKSVINDTAGKGLGLRAYSNNKRLKDFEKLGFKILRKGVNWHNLKYGRLRSDTGETENDIL